MKPTIFRIALLFIAILSSATGGGLLNASPCFALSPISEIRIRSQVEASRKHVALLDVCHPETLPEDWKQELASVDIGETPALGSKKYIYPDNLKKYLERYLTAQGIDPSGVAIDIPASITVESPSMTISAEAIDGAFKEHVLSHAPWDRRSMTIQKLVNISPITLRAGEVRYEVVTSPREQFAGNVNATIDIYVNGEKERSLRVIGRVDLYQDVVRTVRPMKRDETLAAEDLEVERINVNNMVNDRFATDANQIVGKRLVRSMGAHQPIFEDNVETAQILKKGDMVRMIYQNMGVMLTAKGKVQDGGDIGGTVHVVNAASHKTITCMVIDSETVRVMQ